MGDSWLLPESRDLISLIPLLAGRTKKKYYSSNKIISLS